MEHGIVPRQIVKSTEAIIGSTSVIERAAEQESTVDLYQQRPNIPNIAASPYALNTPAHPNTADYKHLSRHTPQELPEAAESDTVAEEDSTIQQFNNQQSTFANLTKEQLRKEIRDTQRKMQQAAKEMDFLAAAKFRDQIRAMQQALDTAR